MKPSPMKWKKGRGKLGVLDPLIGHWVAKEQTERGPLVCTRTISRILDNKYVRLSVVWEFPDFRYEELAIYGVGPDGNIVFWSFTSDGKNSQGYLADVSDIHDLAIGFEARMPAGLGRMAYWPDEASGYHWVVEAQTKKGWNRFTHHHYQATEEDHQ